MLAKIAIIPIVVGKAIWYTLNGKVVKQKAEFGYAEAEKIMSRERLKLPVIQIQLEEVGIPPELEMVCNSCGELLVYGAFPYIGVGPYCRVEAPLIWGYRCESCGLKLYLPEMATQLNKRILEAMKNERIWPPQEDL